MKRLISLIKNIRRAVGMSLDFAPRITVGLFAITIIAYLAPLLQAKLLGNIVNKIVGTLKETGSAQALLVLILSYAAVWGGIRILNALQLYFEKIWHMENEHGLELAALKKRAEIDLGHYENPDFQNLLHRAFNRGIWPVFEIADAQFQTIANIAVIIVSSIIASAISWKLYLIIMVTSIPSFIVQLKYGYKAWGIWVEHSTRQRLYYSMRWHLINRTGVTQTKLLQNKGRIMDIISGALESFKKDNMLEDKKRFYLQTGASVIAAFGFGFSMWMIAEDVVSGIISVGAMVFIISALGQLVGSLNSLLSQLATQLEKNLYVEDIFKVLDTKPFIKRSEHPIKLNLQGAPTIEFKNVSFKYEGREDWILRHINLVINPREKVALVGMNGAGKSTLVKLLSRIYDPTEGDILINSVNLREIDIDEWGSYISVLLQDYLTYDLTVSESIGMGRAEKELDKQAVIEATEYSEADEFINEWEKKYDQQLGKEFDEGVEPSKGQQQKIALARTIYRAGLVMILDEPTAAIDALSETKIFEQMEKAVGENTLILITHRFNTTQNVDKIVVLDKGEIREVGTHKELIAQKGLYKEMFDSQAKAFETKKEV